MAFTWWKIIINNLKNHTDSISTNRKQVFSFLYHSKIIKAHSAVYEYLQEFKFTKKLKIKIKIKLNLFFGILAEKIVPSNQFGRTDHNRYLIEFLLTLISKNSEFTCVITKILLFIYISIYLSIQFHFRFRRIVHSIA